MTEVAGMVPLASEYYHGNNPRSKAGAFVLGHEVATLGPADLSAEQQQYAAAKQAFHRERVLPGDRSTPHLTKAEFIAPDEPGLLAYAKELGITPQQRVPVQAPLRERAGSDVVKPTTVAAAVPRKASGHTP